MYEDGMAWNEANTFTKLIYQNLTKELGYPDRGSEYVDEQTWVRKRNGQSGPYDCVVFSANGLVLLIEAKKENKNLTCADIKQAQDYALSTDFGCWPPPFILVSNGKEFIWLSRKFNKCGEPYYEKCNPKSYADACKSKAGKLPTDQISLKQLISLLIRTRIMTTEREKKAAYLREWRAKNKEEIRVYIRDYNRAKSEVWKNLPNEKKLELMNNLCIKLINK